MPWITDQEMRRPGSQPVTRDVKVKRMGQRRMVNRNMMGLAGLPYKTVTDFSYGAEGGMGSIVDSVFSIVRDVATATGIINPLSHYEPGLSPQQVFVKYDADITDHNRRLQMLGSDTQKAVLQAKLNPIISQRDSLRPLFTVGSVLGDRDIERLGAMVYAFRQWRKAWDAAKLTVGIRAPLASPTAIKPAPTAQKGMSPLVLGAMGLIAWKIFG